MRLKAARKDVTLRWYEGQDHRMEGAAFARSIDRTADFFSENLREMACRLDASHRPPP